MQSLWKRCGRILGPDMLPGNYRLTQVPTTWSLPNGLLRIAFSARDQNNHGQMLAVDVDPVTEMRIVREHFSPLVSLAACPSFAKDGIGPSDAIRVDDRLYLYGASLDLDAVPYDNSIVLLESDNNGLSFAPPLQVLSSRDNNGFPVALPAVKRFDNLWHLWYTAFDKWILDAKPHPDARYQIRHATSSDGRVWHAEQNIAVGFVSDLEAGMARPTLLDQSDNLEMWFSVRGPYSETIPSLRRYRIAYATSTNGKTWNRNDKEHQFINPSVSGDWDDEMQCYPHVFTTGDRTYMLYCGNGYGVAGFGFAVRI